MLDIVHRIAVRNVPIHNVYQAIASRQGVSSWWIPASAGDDSLGGTMVFGGLMELKVSELAQDQRVTWEVVGGPEDWVGTTITFDLKAEDDFTVVLFGHRGWAEQSEHMAHCSTKWAVFLLSLKQYLETGVGRPGADVLPTDNW